MGLVPVIESARVWEEAGRVLASARFEGSKKGIAAAEAFQQQAIRSGFALIDVQLVGGGTDVPRSLGKSALGLGLLGATGFGFIGTSRKRTEILTVYEKVGPSQGEIETEQRLREIETLGKQRAVASQDLFTRAASGRTPFRVSVQGIEPRGGGWLQKYSVKITVAVTNTSSEAFDGFELRAVLHDAKGRTVASSSPTFEVALRAYGGARASFTMGGLPKGDYGSVISVSRVLRGGVWRDV